jgi:hypothetical protein
VSLWQSVGSRCHVGAVICHKNSFWNISSSLGSASVTIYSPSRLAAHTVIQYLRLVCPKAYAISFSSLLLFDEYSSLPIFLYPPITSLLLGVKTCFPHYPKNWGSLVSIGTSLHAGWPRYRGSIPIISKEFFLPDTSRPPVEPSLNPLFDGYGRCFAIRLKRPVCEASTDIKTECSYTCILTACLHGVHRECRLISTRLHSVLSQRQ